MSDWLDKERHDEDTPATPVAKGKLHWLKRPKTWALFAFAAIVLVVIWYAFAYEMNRITDSDVIHRYEVTVTPQTDGKMLVHYDIDWEVLNSLWTGPLTKVVIGVDNEYFTVVETGGAVKSHTIKDNTYVTLQLDERYRKGQTINIQLTILQDRLLRAGPRYSSEENVQYTVTFTPCWFEDIAVEGYTFRWKDTAGTLKGHNADYTRDGWLVWQGSLLAGGKTTLSLAYETATFEKPNTQRYSNAYASSKHKDMNWAAFILLLIAIGGFKILWGYAFPRNRARGGRGCACASCACAGGRCAGGGRAGCSEKGFVYENPYSDLFREVHKTQGPEDKKTQDIPSSPANTAL